MPDLGSIDPVPMRALARLQEVIDRGRGGAPGDRRILERLDIVAALGVGLHAEGGDDVAGGEGRHVGISCVRTNQNRFLRSRSSANAATGSAPAMPIAAARAG